MSQNEELVLIPKYEKYMQYMVEAIVKMPRTEKLNKRKTKLTLIYWDKSKVLFEHE